jgi:hypothetical protein
MTVAVACSCRACGAQGQPQPAATVCDGPQQEICPFGRIRYARGVLVTLNTDLLMPACMWAAKGARKPRLGSRSAGSHRQAAEVPNLYPGACSAQKHITQGCCCVVPDCMLLLKPWCVTTLLLLLTGSSPHLVQVVDVATVHRAHLHARHVFQAWIRLGLRVVYCQLPGALCPAVCQEPRSAPLCFA